LKDAIDLNNDLDIAWHFLGMLSTASGDTEMARSYFSTAVQKNPWMLQSVAELKRLEISGTVEPGPDLEERKAYVEAFGFTDDPFTRVPYHRYAYLSGSRHEAMESLVRAVKKRSGPVLLGAAGTGKRPLWSFWGGWQRKGAPGRHPQALGPGLSRINAEIGVTADSDSIKATPGLGMRIAEQDQAGTPW
jgi:hypothetical protein